MLPSPPSPSHAAASTPSGSEGYFRARSDVAGRCQRSSVAWCLIFPADDSASRCLAARGRRMPRSRLSAQASWRCRAPVTLPCF